LLLAGAQIDNLSPRSRISRSCTPHGITLCVYNDYTRLCGHCGHRPFR
jgi:hypothetical protein